MKLLKIRLKNLNSLYGEWEIDLTHPDYASEGIFLVTGLTGAGKSTILDAVCLALYGRVPRLKVMTENDNFVMSRHTADCLAEVTFEVDNKKYRARWTKRLARNKTNGKPQPATHLLIDGDTDMILTEKTNSGTVNAITELLQMDFHRFCHSVLLPQGQFAAFLKGNKSERSEILQAITGTEIYGQVSFWIHNHFLEYKQQLNEVAKQLEVVTILSPEVQKQHQDSRDSLSKHILELRREIASLTLHVNLLKQLREVHDRFRQNERQRELLQQRRIDFQPVLKRLTEGTLAAKLQPFLALRTRLNSQYVLAESKVCDCQAELISTAAKLEPVLHEYNLAKQALLAAQERYNSSLEVWNAVRELDIHINNLAQDSTKTSQKMQVLREKMISLQSLLKARQDEIACAIENSERIKRIAQCRVEVEPLPDALAAVCLAQFLLDRIKGDLLLMQSRKEFVQTRIEELLLQQKDLNSSFELLRNQQYFVSQAGDWSKCRDALVDGEPCPLCGATEHPYSSNDMQPLTDHSHEIENKQKVLKKIDSELVSLRMKIGSMNLEIEQKKFEQPQAEQNLRDKKQVIAAIDPNLLNLSRDELMTKITDLYEREVLLLAAFDSQAHDLVSDENNNLTRALLSQNEVLVAELLAKREKDRATLLQDVLTHEAKLAPLQATITILESQYTETNSNLLVIAGEYDACQKEYEVKRKHRATLFGDRNPNIEESSLRKEIEDCRKNLTQAESCRTTLQDKELQIQTTLTFWEQSRDAIGPDLTVAVEDFQTALANSGFPDEDTFLKAITPAEELERYDAERQELDKQATTLDSLSEELNRRESALKCELSRAPSDLHTLTEEEAVDRLNCLNDENEKCNGEMGRIDAILQANSAQCELYQNLMAEQTNLRNEQSRWQILDNLIGSPDGKKFRNIVQSITFNRVLDLANIQLSKMTDRYLLCQDETEPLLPAVLDRYQADEIRPVCNLSGGETFLVSLALSFGLSELISSKKPLHSLFLDEGFGSLDGAALDAAIATLQTTNRSGKLIGIISHIPAIEERIGTHINVVALSGGRSRIEGPGCREIR
ncbi:MAG: AAA family ATPase [Planctomycetia bacterium]|nr:AAA family ATPase [Planctomycetia bacterium]